MTWSCKHECILFKTTEGDYLNTWIGGKFKRSTILSISSSCASTYMEHVNSEGVETRDIDTPREGPHYAIGPLSLILIRQDKKRGLFSMPDSECILSVSEIQTACQHIDIHTAVWAALTCNSPFHRTWPRIPRWPRWADLAVATTTTNCAWWHQWFGWMTQERELKGATDDLR